MEPHRQYEVHATLNDGDLGASAKYTVCSSPASPLPARQSRWECPLALQCFPMSRACKGATRPYVVLELLAIVLMTISFWIQRYACIPFTKRSVTDSMGHRPADAAHVTDQGRPEFLAHRMDQHVNGIAFDLFTPSV
jgi:hypothetical protein